MLNNLKYKLVALSSILGIGILNTLVFAQSKCTVNNQEVPCEQITGAIGKFFGGFLLLTIIAAIVGILASIFWLMMIIHAATKPIENKGVWIIVMVLTGIIGAIIYYFVVKRKFQAPIVQPQSPTQTPPTQ